MPLVSKTFDQLLDFTRTSAATFVGSNGLVQSTPASVNLLLQTQQFDNAAWTKTAATVTANSTVAPDGTSTADTLIGDGTNANHAVQQTNTASATGKTFSIYAKAGTNSFLQVYFAVDTAPFANFDLSSGVVGTVGSGATASIMNVGDGWYRCVVVITSTTATTPVIQLVPASTSTRGAASTLATTVFLWGAQIEVGSTLTTYTRNNGGRFPPRFDYDPVTLAAKGLLIEEQRTNLLLRSQLIGGTSWTSSDVTCTTNSILAPDGTTTASLVTESSTTAAHAVYGTSATFSVTAHTISIFIKAGTRRYVSIRGETTAASTYAWITFDTTTGAINANASVTSSSATAFGNGWWRVTMTWANTNAASTCNVVIAGSDVSTAPVVGSVLGNSYLGNGSTFYVWGAQVEAGSFATSYIPTVASQVTRTADQCSIVAPNFAPWYNQSEGTLVAEFSTTNSIANNTRGATITDGTNRAVDIYIDTGVWRSFNGTTNVTPTGSTAVLGATVKFAAAYKSGDYAASMNGGTVGTASTAGVQSANRLTIGTNITSSAGFLNGHIRSIRYYPTRLTNAQLQALTA